MTYAKFWEQVKVNTPYGKYHSAHITCNGYDYCESATLKEGKEVATIRLYTMLIRCGQIKRPLIK